ncbi:MAG: hypothetical protein JNK82_01850 [Myxococcaceae bacterium]|nr:hypothetical protein [Myxococcaceae bacterium]
MAASVNGEAFLVRADGARVTLVSAEGPQAWVGAPVVRGPFVLVGTTRRVDGQLQSALHLFDSSGARLGTLEGAAAGELSADGVVSAAASTGLVLLGPDGSVFREPGLHAAGAFGGRSLLPVAIGESGRQLGIFDARTHQLTPLGDELTSGSSPVWSGEVLVYLAQRGERVALVRHHAGLTLATPLVGRVAGAWVEQVTDTDAILVTGFWVQSRSRVNLATGEVTPFEIELPEAHVAAGQASASFAEDGTLVMALAKDDVAGLFGSRDGKHWEPLGEGVPGASWVQFAGRNGTWLLSAAGPLGWASSTTVAVMPALRRAVELPSMVNAVPNAESVSADGRCAAVWTGSGTGFSLVTVDLLTATQRTLVTSTARPSSVAWLE